MRGQVEFIAVILIVAIVILGVYAGLTFISPSGTPQALSLEHQAVEAFVEKALKEASVNVITFSEYRGGFLFPQTTTTYQFHPVNYWQRCEENIVPDKTALESHLGNMISRSFTSRLANITELSGKPVRFNIDAASDKVTIHENKIDVVITVPTTVSGTAFPGEYTVSIPSRYGRIYNFGKDFVAEATKAPENGGRPFEAFYQASVFFSRHLPTIGTLTGCGETISLSPEEISTHLEDLAKHMISNVYWWIPMQDQSGTNDVKFFSVEQVNGKQYQDLDIGLRLPDQFSIETIHPIFLSNHQILYTFLLGPIPVCEQSFHIEYDTAFPVIFSVKDDLLGNDFRFAVFTATNGTAPATGDSCHDGGVASSTCKWEPETQANGETIMVWRCHGSQDSCASNCSARLQVQDIHGDSLPGATAIVGSCLVGHADQNGVITGPVSCEQKDLLIHKTGYDFIQNVVTPQSVNRSYTLHYIPQTTISFNDVVHETKTYTVPQYSGASRAVSYTACNVNPSPNFIIAEFDATDSSKEFVISNIDPVVSDNCAQTTVCQDCVNGDQSTCNLCSTCYFTSLLPSVNVSYIPGGSYDMNAILRVNDRFLIRGVAGKDSYTMGEDNGQSFALNIHRAKELQFLNPLAPLPAPREIWEIDRSEVMQLSEKLKTACNIDPITPVSPNSTIAILGTNNCDRESIEAFLSEIAGSCSGITQNDINSLCNSNIFTRQYCVNNDLNATRNRINTLLMNKCNREFLGCIE